MSNFAHHCSRHIPPRRTRTAAGEICLVGVATALLLLAVLLALDPKLVAPATLLDNWSWRFA